MAWASSYFARSVRGAKTIYIGLGGSATNDGGAGMLQALGAHLVDECGCNIAPGLAGLEHVASIDLTPALRVLEWRAFVALSDVENPLVGAPRCTGSVWRAKGLPTDDAEALGKYDSWMVGYGRLLDAAITGVRAQGLLRVPEVHGHLVRCSACPVPVLPAAWVPRCWRSVPSCVPGRGDGARSDWV